jgi:hypothetical protein
MPDLEWPDFPDLPIPDFGGGGGDPIDPGPLIDPGGVDLGGGGGGGGGDGGGSGFGDLAGRVIGGVGRAAGKVGAGLGKEFTDSPLSAFAKTLGLGATGYNFINQGRMASQMNEQAKRIKQGQDAARAAAAPAIAAGTADVNRAQAGKLQPAMEASIAQWVEKAKADVQARFAQMGLGNSSQIQSALAQIDQAALAMRGQLLQGEQAGGITALQTGVSAGRAEAEVGAQQQQMLAQLIAAANRQLGLLGGSQG